MNFHIALSDRNHRESLLQLSPHEKKGKNTIQISVLYRINRGRASRIRQPSNRYLAQMVVGEPHLRIIVRKEGGKDMNKVAVYGFNGLAVHFKFGRLYDARSETIRIFPGCRALLATVADFSRLVHIACLSI